MRTTPACELELPPVEPIYCSELMSTQLCCLLAGQVMIQRVNGSLAVSRALGDFDYKSNQTMGPCEQLVSPEPEVSKLQTATWFVKT